MNEILSSAATTAAHHDPSRVGVGTTAFWVAVTRAMEGKIQSRRPLVRDEVAEAMFDWRTKPKSIPWIFCIMYSLWCWLFITWPFFSVVKILWKRDINAIVDMIGIRTKFIDDFIDKAVREKDIKQVIIVGSGLDARAVRLISVYRKEGKDVKLFELDFHAMLTAKLEIFSSISNHYGRYLTLNSHLVGADLSLSPAKWQNDIRNYGFDPSLPSIWIMEGFTGYLEENELRELLVVISDLSASGSEICATWNGTSQKTKGSHWSQPIHRTLCDNPDIFFSELSYKRNILVSLGEALRQAGLAQTTISFDDNTYWLTLYSKK